jgi:F-type H+-transporting ATPase subunit epsilon
VALDVHLVTPERDVWSGPAEMVVARGVDGDVGILSGHAPLLIRMAIAPLRIRREGGEWLVAVVDGGFLHVTSEGTSTRVDVLATHAELAHEVDVSAARRLKDEAETRLQTRDTGVAEAGMEHAKAELARAVARITVAG